MANIRDLARMAGVSVTTVSRVLNNHPYVSEEKKKAVLRAIEESNMSLFNLSVAMPVFASGEVPEKAHNFADVHFLSIVKEHLGSQHAGNFNLNPESENITFGPLFPVYTMTTDEFVTKKSPKLDNGIVQSNEYIAVVYQDGKPVNVIGTYQNEAGEFALSTFGYGLDLAKKMDKLKADEKILYEFPADAWYLYNGKKIKPLTETAKAQLKGEVLFCMPGMFINLGVKVRYGRLDMRTISPTSWFRFPGTGLFFCQEKTLGGRTISTMTLVFYIGP